MLQTVQTTVSKTRCISVGGLGAIHDSTHCSDVVRVTGYGRFYNGVEQDWTFRHFNTSEDAAKDTSITRHLPTIAHRRGIPDILAPTPEFGTTVVHRSSLCVAVPIGGTPVTLWRGCRGDIMELAPGETFGISTGGCAVVWLYFANNDVSRLIVGHAGRKNLLEIPRAMLRAAIGDTPTGDVSVGVAFPISPINFEHAFDDPTYGEHNKLLCEELVERFGEESVLDWGRTKARTRGRIDMGWVLQQQFAELGVSTKKMHGTPCYDMMPAGTDSERDGYLWHTTRSRNPLMRNLVLVSHLTKPSP